MLGRSTREEEIEKPATIEVAGVVCVRLWLSTLSSARLAFFLRCIVFHFGRDFKEDEAAVYGKGGESDVHALAIFVWPSGADARLERVISFSFDCVRLHGGCLPCHLLFLFGFRLLRIRWIRGGRCESGNPRQNKIVF